MKRALDGHGTTCWWCGKAGQRNRVDEGLKHRCCINCRSVNGTREEVRAALNYDIEQIKSWLRDGTPPTLPRYFTLARYAELAKTHEGYPVEYLDKLKWKEWQDNEAAGTQERTHEAQKRYQREYYHATKGEGKREYYQKQKAIAEQRADELLNNWSNEP